jgi:hypothetical protein
MTKEELIDKIKAYSNNTSDNIAHDVYEFFESNICIPKGENRHPSANILHALAEDKDIPIEWFNDNYQDDKIHSWLPMPSNVFYINRKIRIKPSEPTYEYKVMMVYSDGTYELTDRYFTVEEYEEFGFPKTCTIDDATKKVRQ